MCDFRLTACQDGGKYSLDVICLLRGKSKYVPTISCSCFAMTSLNRQRISSVCFLSHSVHSVLAYDGRPNGTAFVHFSSAADAENAMAKDKAMMRARYVELFHSCEDEMQMAVGR